MALDPLKFQVAIQDDATRQLSSIESALNSLKDKTISVKVEGLSDLQNLLSALQHQQVNNLGKDVGNAINEASRNLQKEAQDAVRTSLGNLAQDLASIKTAIQNDNFTAFSNRIQKCAEAVDTLDAAFKKFHVTIGQNDGMRNFMTGLGEVIRNVRTTMGMLNGGLQGASATPDAMARSVKVAQHETERLNNDLVRAQRTIETFGDKGFNVSALERYKAALIDVRENLRLIERNGGIHPLTGLTASQYLTSEDASRVVSLLKTELSYYKNIGNELERIGKIRSTLTSILSTNPTTAYRGDIHNALAGLDLREGLLARQGARDAMQTLNSEAYNQQIKNAVSLISKVSSESRQSAKDTAHLIESMRRAGIAVSDLAAKFDKLEIAKIRANAVKANVDTTAYDRAVERMERYRRVLEYIARSGGHDADRITKSVGYRNASNDLNIQAAALKALTKESSTTSSATQQLSAEEQRLAQALQSSTDKLHGQSQVLSDLKSMATQYLGVWGAQQFVHNIIQIGGQLEQQRLSIGAILGDMAAGQHLFDQIKQLAVVSPFGVVELDKYTKQLSAYGFKQSELFGMTKRLADISAGAGTEVSRLALALGHVRSEGALTGYTLRQFAMNNIPMLQKLSERLTKIEGQIVSTSEIRKRVSKKEIGYEDVIAVIKDLTNEGGMFFNMQETMADAVNAKFKNLKDSMDIMYGEMAEGGIGTALKKVAETLMFLTRNWEETARVIGYGTAAFVMYRLAVASANTQLMTYGSTLGVTTKSLNAKSIALGIASASVRRLTASEVDEMVTLKLVTREQLLNAVATKTLTVDQAELAAATFGVTRAELSSIASKGKLGIATTGLGLRIRSLILSIRGVGVALKSMFLNPVGIALMAITGAFEVFARWKQKNDEIAQSIDQLGKKGSEGYKNLASTLEKYSGKDGKMSDSEYSTAITDITDTLKNYAPNITNIQREAQSIDDLAKRYEYLRDELESTRNAYADLERTKSFASNANEATGNLLNDTFTENVEDYIGNVHKVDKAEQELMQHRISLEKSLDELERKTNFKRRTDESGNVLPLIEQLKYIRNTDFNRLFSPILYSNSQGASSALADYVKALSQMEERMSNEVKQDLQNFAARLNNQYSGIFGEDWKNNADHIKTAWMAVVSEIDKVPGMTDNVRKDLLEKIFNETWHLNIDFSTGEVTESLTGWRKEMQDWIDEHDLRFRIGFNDSREDIYKKAKAAQEAAQAEMNNAGNVLINIGFKLNNLPKELPSVLQTPWNQKNLEDYVEQKAVNDSWEEFKKHFGANWDSKKKTGSKKTGKSEDKDARRLREIVKLYKDAYDWYGKYEKQVGEGSALAKVKEQFQPLFDEFRNQWKQSLSLDSIPEYKQNLETLLSEAQKLYESPKHKNSYMVEAIKTIRDAINNVDYEEAQRKMDEYASKVQIELDGLTRAWDVFNNVREATGNIDLAVQLSGADYQAGQTRNLADALREKIEQDFASANAIAIPFDINMSDKDVENNIKSAIPKESEERIKGIVEEYKKWRDLQREVFNDAINNYAKILGSLVDHKSQIEKIEDEYKREAELLKILLDSGKITQEQYDEAVGIARGNADSKEWQASTSYINLMNNSLSMTRSEIESAANMQRDYLNRELERGAITAEKYIEEMSKLKNLEREWSDKGFLGLRGGVGAFLSGGNDGLLNYYQSRGKKARTAYANADYKDSPEAQEKLKEAEHYEGLYKSLVELTDGAKKVFTAFQTLQGGIDLVANLFDSLGMEGASTVMSDVSGVLGSALGGASSLSALGPWGMAAGAGLGLLSGIFQLHDKAIQREIDALKENVDALQENTDSIRAARERTLGYDFGSLRKAMAGNYSDPTQKLNIPILGMITIEDSAKRAMQEFYKKNSGRSGYAAELENLKAQREDYLKMYNLENDKKKKSDEALKEYKQQIAELDEQIMYFVEDLANELWGIDLKGWADQISDSLWTAFENGEDAVKAFHETAKDIISDVAKRMMNIHLIEPAMANLEEALFGKIGADGKRIGGGAYNMQTGQFDEDKTLEILGQFFGEDGEFAKVIESAEGFYDMAKRATGIDFSSDNNSSSTGNSIKGITEQTADLLASYVNAIRADVSVNRAMIAQYFPMYYQALTSGNESLRGIENHTAAIMRSNEAIERSNQAILDRIDGLRNKTWKVPMA